MRFISDLYGDDDDEESCRTGAEVPAPPNSNVRILRNPDKEDDADMCHPMKGFEQLIEKIIAMPPKQREDLLKRGIVPQEDTPDEPWSVE